MKKNLPKIEIILIEDSRADAALTLRAFKNMGLEDSVTVLSDGAEAIDYLINSGKVKGTKFGNNANLILLDLLLPKVHGLEVLKALKTNPVTKNLPVVVITASYEDPIKYSCIELGADTFITKPVTPEAFFKVIEELSHYWN